MRVQPNIHCSIVQMDRRCSLLALGRRAFCQKDPRLNSPPSSQPPMLLVVEFEKNYIRETILCLLVGGEYMGVLPGPPGQRAKSKHHSVYAAMRGCKHQPLSGVAL